MDDVPVRKLRQRVNRADVDQFLHVVLFAETHDVFRAADVDVHHALVIFGRDGDNPRAVDEEDLILRLEPVKQRLKGWLIAHISAYNGHGVGHGVPI